MLTSAFPKICAGGLHRTGHFAAGVPFPFQHAVDFQIHEMIIEPLRFSLGPFMDKSQSFRNGSAGRIFARTANIDAVHMPVIDRIIDQPAGACGHDAAPGKVFTQPVAEAGDPIFQIECVKADCSAKVFFEENSERESDALMVAVPAILQVGPRVRGGMRFIEPGKPAPQVVPMAVDLCEDHCRLIRPQEAHINFSIDREAQRHGGSLANTVFLVR